MPPDYGLAEQNGMQFGQVTTGLEPLSETKLRRRKAAMLNDFLDRLGQAWHGVISQSSLNQKGTTILGSVG